MPAAKRPPAVWTTAALLVFLGVTAAGGGVAMLAGGGAAPPDEWLDAIPLIQDWRLPGLVLLIGFGAGSVVTAYGVLRRRRCRWLGPVERLTGQHWSWLATTMLGLGQVVWIALELAYLPQLSFLQPCYALVGLVLLLLPLHPQVRAYLARTAAGPARSGRATLPPTRGRAQAPEERQPEEGETAMKSWTVDDVMTRAVVSVDPAASYRNMVDLLIERRFSALPVIDAAQRVVGVVSEADLLRKIEYAGTATPRTFDTPRRRGERRKAQGRTAAELMSVPPVTVRSGTSIAAAARLMDDENVKRLPVVDGPGHLIGIVSRADLLKTHLRSDPEILADVETDVLATFLDEESASVTVAVVDGVVTLSGRVDRWSSAEIAARLSRQVAGVVHVISTLAYRFDDRDVRGVRAAVRAL